MSKINSEHVFTSESVSEGHPDKICDQISDAVLDACLKRDINSRVACETLVTTNLVVTAGEVNCTDLNDIDTEIIARNVVREIGYDSDKLNFSADNFEYINRIHNQSKDISQGVDVGKGLYDEQGAGDQGMMFGYADSSTKEYMPAPIAYSHRLLNELQKIRKDKKLDYLRPDSKSQVSVRYKNGVPIFIDSIVISHQTDDIPLSKIREDLIDAAKTILDDTNLLSPDTLFYINPTGRFVSGGPHGDAGLTGRKIIVDTYGGIGSHGGGAFSGKDPSKVDRSAAYYARYAAKNIVAAELAEKCEIQVAYAIGVAKPISINVDTYNTGIISDEILSEMIIGGDVFDFRPAKLISDLKLLTPDKWSYRESAAYGHFGRDQFPWEKIDKVELIHKNLK